MILYCNTKRFLVEVLFFHFFLLSLLFALVLIKVTFIEWLISVWEMLFGVQKQTLSVFLG